MNLSLSTTTKVSKNVSRLLILLHWNLHKNILIFVLLMSTLKHQIQLQIQMQLIPSLWLPFKEANLYLVSTWDFRHVRDVVQHMVFKQSSTFSQKPCNFSMYAQQWSHTYRVTYDGCNLKAGAARRQAGMPGGWADQGAGDTWTQYVKDLVSKYNLLTMTTDSWKVLDVKTQVQQNRGTYSQTLQIHVQLCLSYLDHWNSHI